MTLRELTVIFMSVVLFGCTQAPPPATQAPPPPENQAQQQPKKQASPIQISHQGWAP